jgi:hypothetical protein
MIEEYISLRFGYFEEFSDSTLMFFGDCNSLKFLFDALSSLSSRDFIQLDTESQFKSVNNESLSLRLVPVAKGLLRYKANYHRCSFEWQLSSNQAVYLAGKVKTVIDANYPCHDYLETEELDDAIVVVSKDEYPMWWPDKQA